MTRKLEFKYQDRTLEARAEIEDQQIYVTVFEGNKRVIPRTYYITTATNVEAFKDDASIDYNVKCLLEMARDDVLNRKSPVD